MYTYQFAQWLFFFYLYCFIGWCFETTYVSLCKKRFVNRGFMNGPFLPIYGSGAIVILMAALPFKSSPVAVYFVGALAATVLELVTGMVMEALFKVRYWDYSNQKFNFKGHICLSSTVVWGAFSVAMIYGFHRPIEAFVFWLPLWFVKVGSFVLTIVIASDFAISFKTALELRDMLITVEKVKKEMKLMQKRVEVIEAILADEAEQRKEQFAEYKEQLLLELSEIRDKQLVKTEGLRQKLNLGRDKINLLRRNPNAHSITEYNVSFESVKHGFVELKNGLKEGIRENVIENIVQRLLDKEEKEEKEDK